MERGAGQLLPETGNPVKSSSEYVCSLATRVSIDRAAIAKAVDDIDLAKLQEITSPKAYNTDIHFVDGGPLTAQYLLVVDALNFCFWQDEDLEYEQLSTGVKAALEADPTALDAPRLAAMTGEGVQRLLRWPRPVPLQEERARILREVGAALQQHFGGQAARLVEAAGGSALALVQLVAQHVPGFRDQAVYKGRQVFLYKRAQIFVGDLYGAYGGKGLGAFHDIDQITMFADYRVPVVLRVLDILRYSPELEAKIASQQEIPPCSEEEVEIRAATVVAVEQLRDALAAKFQGVPGATLPHAVQLDWWLWELGERERHRHPPHHRTLTVFY